MIHIEYKFVFLNEFINATRTNKYVSAKIKKDATTAIHYMLLGKEKIKTPCKLKYTWTVKNKRMDPDNISFAKKYVNDGLVKAGLIPDDSLKYITGFIDEFEIGDTIGVKIAVIPDG